MRPLCHSEPGAQPTWHLLLHGFGRGLSARGDHWHWRLQRGNFKINNIIKKVYRKQSQLVNLPILRTLGYIALWEALKTAALQNSEQGKEGSSWSVAEKPKDGDTDNSAQHHGLISQMSRASTAEMTYRREMLNFRINIIPRWCWKLYSPLEI